MRLVQLIIQENKSDQVENILKKTGIEEYWSEQHENLLKFSFITQTADLSEILTNFEKEIKFDRILVIPLEATLPRIDPDKPEGPATKTQPLLKIKAFKSISKEELYEDIARPVGLSFNYIFLVILSAFVAGIGIIQANSAILIGAMVIAPFLNPNIALAFGTTLGDISTIKKSLTTGITATMIALVISVIWGFTDYNIHKIEREVVLGYRDVLLALVCGFAGVISVLSGRGSTLVGVMVAAALLPPLMRAGLFLGGGHFQPSLTSFLIFSTNIICLNIAGIITFYIAGIRPHKWWEKEKANKKTRVSLIAWVILLIILITIIHYFGKFF